MTNRHRQKYISRLLVGVALFNLGLLLLLYLIIVRPPQQEKYLWAAGAFLFFNGGFLALASAIVHKVKADLIRRQKQKDQHKKYEFE